MTTKISQLKHGSSNVQVEGVVRRKSDLNEGQSTKYFFFYLHDAESNSIRITAFKEVALKFFDKIQNEKSYRISKVSASNNYFRGETSLQIILTTSAEITPIADIAIGNIVITPLSKLNSIAKGANVNVIGRIIEMSNKDVTLSQGTPSSVLIVTLMDYSHRIDATFWDHKEKLSLIAPDEVSLTVVSIEGATVSTYRNSLTLNVNKSSVVKINPSGEKCDELRKISGDSFYINLSQQSSQSSQVSGQNEYPTATIVSAIKRDLKEIEDEIKDMDEKQERLKIRKMVLSKELSKYE